MGSICSSIEQRVLGVFESGNPLGEPQAVPNCRENISGTPGTVTDIYFWFAAATVGNGRMDLD